MPQRRDPDRDLFINALAVGLPLPSARKVAQLSKAEAEHVADDEPERFEAARRGGYLARNAPHLVPEPDPLPEERWPEYFALVAGGKRPSQAAGIMGVQPMAIYLARQVSKRFAEVERAAEASTVEEVEDVALALALEGSEKMIEMWLKNRAPERWGGQSGGKGGINIGTLNINQSPEEARARVEEIRRELAERNVIDAEVVDPDTD